MHNPCIGTSLSFWKYSEILFLLIYLRSMSHRASLATARGMKLWNCWNVVCMECMILYSSGNKITTTTTTATATATAGATTTTTTAIATATATATATTTTTTTTTRKGCCLMHRNVTVEYNVYAHFPKPSVVKSQVYSKWWAIMDCWCTGGKCEKHAVPI